MSFDEAVPSSCHADFEAEDQFRGAAIEIAKVAHERALEIEVRFSSFHAIADFVVERARSSPDRMGPSWWGYEAGIVSGILGRLDDARYFLRGLTDERVARRAAPLLPLIDQPEAFSTKVNDLVTQQRAVLRMEPLESQPF